MLRQNNRPVALVLTRQNLPTLDRTKYASAAGVARGAYVLADAAGGRPEVILIGTGSEVSLCVEAYERLTQKGIKARVVSMPCWELFDEQPAEYRQAVLPAEVTVPRGRRGRRVAGLGPLPGLEGPVHRHEPFWRERPGPGPLQGVWLHGRSRGGRSEASAGPMTHGPCMHPESCLLTPCFSARKIIQRRTPQGQPREECSGGLQRQPCAGSHPPVRDRFVQVDMPQQQPGQFGLIHAKIAATQSTAANLHAAARGDEPVLLPFDPQAQLAGARQAAHVRPVRAIAGRWLAGIRRGRAV